MALTPSKEGKIPFQAPIDTPCFTFYKVFGDLACGKAPVVVLHGGPGSGHEYLLAFAQLWPRFGIPVVFYDQIGCASSTHLREAAGDQTFWQESLFIAELENVLDHLQLRQAFSLLGHSWGGMLGAAFAATRPQGLRRLVLAGAIASMELSTLSMTRWSAELPLDQQKAIAEAVRTGDYTTAAFKEAADAHMKLTWCRVEPTPPELLASRKNRTEDTTAHMTMIGSIYKPTGSLRDWTVIPRLPKIDVPTLVYHGEFDSSDTQCTQPFFDLIPRVRWVTISQGSHMCHTEGPKLWERIIRLVGDFFDAGSMPE